MPRHPTAPRGRVLEAVLWAAALLAGILVLLPSAVEFVQARKLEDELRSDRERSERELHDDATALEQIANDPQADRKLAEQYGLDWRTEPEAEDAPVRPPAGAPDPRPSAEEGPHD